jgi:hypothetical protein
MKKNETILIVLLLATAGILTAMLVMSWQGTSQTAEASVGVQGGDYIMTAAKVRTGKQVLYIIDARNRKMMVYYLNEKTDSLDPLTGMALKKVRQFQGN